MVPSQTELLFDLGLDEAVIGITKFCVHPSQWLRNKTRVGGTKQLHIDQIISLHPDLIIANKEENVEEQINELAKHFPVWISDIKTLDDAYAMMKMVGAIVDHTTTAISMVERIRFAFEKWQELRSNFKLQTSNLKLSCAYLIWNDPMMSIGSDTFIHHMLGVAGFENVFADRKRYPEISMEDLRKKNPEFMLLSSEPFPFKQKHADKFQENLPNSKIIFVDGEMFSWYGSRLLKAPEYFEKLWATIHASNF